MADWQQIVRTHGPMAFATGWRLLGNSADTEECVQEAMFDAFRLFQREKIDNWGGALRQLTTRRAIDRLRKRHVTEEMVVHPHAPAIEQPDSIASQKELAERLRMAVANLPDRQASVFALHVFGEMERSEIALALGISEGAGGVALHKARGKLKESFRGDLASTDGNVSDSHQNEEQS